MTDINGKRSQVRATRDTGCTRTIIKTMAGKKRGIHFQSGDPTILLTACGQRMRVDGAAMITVEANSISTNISTLVSNLTRCYSAI